MLNNFGLGWRNKFEKRFEYVLTSLNNVSLTRVKRYKGMLRSKFKTDDNELQYVLDCVSYKIERESVTVCETCGDYGRRRITKWLSEPMCLCIPCYVKLVDDLISQQ
jgi:hypothetical protein